MNEFGSDDAVTEHINRRELISFRVGDVFPADDPVAIALLRLMTFHDDLSVVGDLMRANMTIPAGRGSLQIAASRWFFLQRVFGGLVAELVRTLSNTLTDGQFRQLIEALDADGRDALRRLEAIPRDVQHPVYRVLERTRNKATFHQDPGEYADVLRRWGPDAESSFVFESEPDVENLGHTYYGLADAVATEIAYGLPTSGVPLVHEAFHAAVDLHAALTTFVDSAFVAYCRLRGISADRFKREAAE